MGTATTRWSVCQRDDGRGVLVEEGGVVSLGSVSAVQHFEGGASETGRARAHARTGLALLGISGCSHLVLSMEKMLLLVTKKSGVSNLQQPWRGQAEQARRIACMPDSPPTSKGAHLEEVKKADATDSGHWIV